MCVLAADVTVHALPSILLERMAGGVAVMRILAVVSIDGVEIGYQRQENTVIGPFMSNLFCSLPPLRVLDAV